MSWATQARYALSTPPLKATTTEPSEDSVLAQRALLARSFVPVLVLLFVVFVLVVVVVVVVLVFVVLFVVVVFVVVVGGDVELERARCR